MTGKRSSSTARREPGRLPERGRRGARRVGSARRPPGRSRPRRTRARPRSSQTASTSAPAEPGRRARRAVVAMQVMTAGSGASGQLRVEVARPLRPRVGRQRPELAVGRGLVVARAGPWRSCPKTPSPRPSSWSLRGASASDGRPGARRRARTGCRPASSSSSSRNGFGRGPAGGERVDGRARRLEVGEERVVGGRRRRGGRAAGAGSAAPARPGGPPSSRGRRPPSSRTSDGRSPGRRTAGCARRSASSVTSTMRMSPISAESTAGPVDVPTACRRPVCYSPPRRSRGPGTVPHPGKGTHDMARVQGRVRSARRRSGGRRRDDRGRLSAAGPSATIRTSPARPRRVG